MCGSVGIFFLLVISDSNFLQQDKTIEWIIFTKTFGMETNTDFTPFLVDFKMMCLWQKSNTLFLKKRPESVFELSINT